MATFEDLAETWRNIHSPIGHHTLNLEEIRSISESNFKAFQINTNALTAIDLRTNQYLFVDRRIEQVSGYTREEYLKGGPRFMFSKIPIRHKIGVIQSSWHQNKFISSLSAEQIHDLIITREYNIIDKEKRSRRILHQVINHVIDRSNNVLAVISLQTLIGNISKASRFNYYIFSKSKNEIIYAKSSRNKFKEFTARELEIIDLVSKGHTSQQIADLLYVSLHTIKTHRKNILRKSNSSNFYELLDALRS